MSSGYGARPNRFLALAGIQAGVMGGLILLGYLALDSKWHKRSVWTVPNLMASTFYGESAYQPGFGARTSAGLALLLFVYGLLGVLFGLVIRDHASRARVTLAGVDFRRRMVLSCPSISYGTTSIRWCRCIARTAPCWWGTCSMAACWAAAFRRTCGRFWEWKTLLVQSKVDLNNGAYGDGLAVFGGGLETPVGEGVERVAVETGIERLLDACIVRAAIGVDFQLQDDRALDFGVSGFLRVCRVGFVEDLGGDHALFAYAVNSRILRPGSDRLGWGAGNSAGDPPAMPPGTPPITPCTSSGNAARDARDDSADDASHDAGRGPGSVAMQGKGPGHICAGNGQSRA